MPFSKGEALISRKSRGTISLIRVLLEIHCSSALYRRPCGLDGDVDLAGYGPAINSRLRIVNLHLTVPLLL
jgi:hypothetical protein